MKKILFKSGFLLLMFVSFLSFKIIPAYATVDFSDVEESYARGAIEELTEKGIINGYPDGTFRPNGIISRQDFAILMAKALGLDLTSSPSAPTFTDIPNHHYSYSAIEAAVKAGLINGIGDGRFGIGASLTREEMATLFARALGDDFTGLGEQLPFADQHTISAWARDAVGFAVESKLITGDTLNQFNPQGVAERQQVALVASRFLYQVDQLTHAPEPKPESKPEPKPEPKPESKPEPKPEPKPESKPEPKPEPKPESKPDPAPTSPPSVVPVTGIILEEGSGNLQVGETKTLTAIVTPVNATNKNVTWRSSNMNVATVDGQGKVTAVGEGTVTITAITVDGLKTANILIEVIIPEVPVTGITLEEKTGNLQVSETKTLTVIVTPANATNQSMTWASSNRTVATVDETGKVTAIAPGNATITVTTADGQFTETYLATVNPSVIILGTSLVGEMVTANTLAPAGATITYQWQKSKTDGTFEDIVGATSSTYTIVPDDVTHFIRVIVTANDSGYSATATSNSTIVITAAAIEGVGTPTTVLQLGETTTRTATTIEEGTKTWVSSDPTIATIDANTGVISAIAEGTTTISYISTNGRTNSVNVTVYPEAEVVNPAYHGISTISGPILPTLNGSNDSATVKKFSLGPNSKFSGRFHMYTGLLEVYTIGTVEIIYFGRDINGVVIEKGSVTFIVNS